MERILNELNRVPGIQGSLVVGEDGIIIQADLAEGINEEELSALMSSLIVTADKIANKLEQGNVKSILLETNKHKWLVHRLKIGYLVVVAEAESNLGLIRLELREAATKINALL